MPNFPIILLIESKSFGTSYAELPVILLKDSKSFGTSYTELSSYFVERK